MGLFGSKTEVAMAVDRTDVVVGEAINATVRLGEPDKKVRSGRVELLYRNTYKYESTDSDGDRTTSTTTKDVVVFTTPLADGGVPQAGDFTVTLHVPANAPGTALKSVEWQVRAVVDRHMGTDAVAAMPIYVRVPAQQLAAWAALDAVNPPECGFAFHVPSRFARPGEQLTGTLSLRTVAPVQARSLELRLRRVRYDQDNNTDTATPQSIVLLQEPNLAAGEIRDLPFAVVVPPDAPPSFYAHHNSQSWFLDAVFNRKLKKDIVGSMQVVIHTI